MATLLQSTTIGGHAAIHAGNIGSQSVNYANSAGSTAWANVSGRPTALSQFTNDLGNYGNWITAAALANYITTSQVTSSMISGLNNMLGITSLPYSVDITVGGDPDRFYAVQFWGGDQDIWRRIIIKRGYSEPAPWDPIGTGVHHGGLLLDWEGNFGGWGGAEYADRLRVFNESYTNVCADMFIYSHSMGYVFMLRGGGALYHIHSDQAINGYYQAGSPDILYSSSTLSYDDNWSGTNVYDVYAPEPLGLAAVNSTRIDGLRTKKQSLLDSRYLRQGVDISGIGNVTSTNSYATNFFASNAFYLNGASYFLNSSNGGIYTNARFESATLLVAPGGNSSQWNTAYGWGNHATAGYLTSYAETNTFLGDGGNGNTHPGTDRIIFTGQLSQGAAVLGMPSTDNSNSIININRHPGEYNSQLGFSSNGSMYYRSFSATAINSTQVWRQVWDSGNLTNLNQLSNGPGYITGYTETDTLNSVVGRGNTTGGNIITSANMYAERFIDYSDNGYYVDPNGFSQLSYANFNGAPSGRTVSLGGDELDRVLDDSARSSLVINAPYYPHLYINANSSADNAYHGPVFSMTGVLSGGGFRRWGMGIANTDPDCFSWGYYDNEKNPHYSVGGTFGYTGTNAKMWLNTNGSLMTTGDMRSREFRFTNSTNNGYLSGNSEWGMRLITDNGYIQFGPANGSYAHIYTDRGQFYFNRDILINNVQVVVNSGTWGINVTGSAGSVAWTNVSGRPTALSQFTNDLVISTTDNTKLPLAGGIMSGRLTLKSISGVEQTVPNDFGAYLHLGAWGVGRTEASAVLVNTAYRADYATDLFDMNISRFTNNSGYITGYTETDTLQSVTNRGASTSAQVSFTKTDDHAISVGTIRGRAVNSQSGEFIQLYERVNIGGPNGWGAANTAAPSYGLSVFGGANIGYGNSAGLSVTGLLRIASSDNLYLDTNYGQSIVGVYSAERYQGIFAMGNSYKLAIDGTTTGNLYGLAWSHPNAGGVAGNLNTHGLLVMENGTFLAAISGTIKARDSITAGANVNATSGYFYGSGSIRVGDMWGGAGLYRPSGSIVFGIEDSDWVFSKGAVTQAYFAGGDGNLWMRWAGDWLSNLLGAKQNASTAINTSNIGSQSVAYATNAGNSNTTSQRVFSDLKINFPSGDGGGHNFSNNHYSMGLDSGNGGWSSPHYRDLIIGYHTGIRLGAHYSGVRFYSDSPTTDTNNDGNGDGGENLLMTVGGYVGTANHTDVVVNNNLFANVSMRAPIFYDSNDTTYYGDFAGTSNLNFLNLGNGREEFPFLKMGANGRYALGVSSAYTRLSAHNGGNGVQLGSYDGTTFTPKLTINNDGNVTAETSLRAPIFYDSNNTAHYIDPSGGSNIRNLYVGDAGDSWSDPGGWGTQVRFSNGPHVRFVLHARTPGIEAGMYVHTPGSVFIGSYTAHNVNMMVAGNSRLLIEDGRVYSHVYMEAAGSMRAPIFYDSQDTGYYGDFASESNLYRFTSASMTRNAMNYLSINSPFVSRSEQGRPYQNGTMGWGNVDFNTVFSNWGSGFIDTWGNPANAPGSSSHYVGLQGFHYNHENSTNAYGFQMVCAGEADNRFFWRSAWPSIRGWVEMIHSGNIGSQTVSNSDMVDGYHASTSTIANGIVVRDGNGYIFGNYINTTDDVVGGSVTGVIVKQGDNYHRTGNQAAIRSFLGLGSLAYSSATIPTNNNQLSNGAGYITSGSNVVGLYSSGWGDGNFTWYQTSGGLAPYGGSWASFLVSNHGDGSNYYNQTIIMPFWGVPQYSRREGGTNRGPWTFWTTENLDPYNLGSSLYVTGSITASGDIVAYSDARVKTNVVTINNALEKVLSLRGVTYTRTDSDDTREKIGVIAQEVQKVLPQVVFEQSNGILGVSYGNMIGVLIEAIKEQQKEIDGLKAKLN